MEKKECGEHETLVPLFFTFGSLSSYTIGVSVYLFLILKNNNKSGPVVKRDSKITGIPNK